MRNPALLAALLLAGCGELSVGDPVDTTLPNETAPLTVDMSMTDNMTAVDGLPSMTDNMEAIADDLERAADNMDAMADTAANDAFNSATNN